MKDSIIMYILGSIIMGYIYLKLYIQLFLYKLSNEESQM